MILTLNVVKFSLLLISVSKTAYYKYFQGLNTAILGQNPDPKTYITMVPTSATTGEGMGNLIALIVELSQTMIAKQLMFSKELLVSTVFSYFSKQ